MRSVIILVVMGVVLFGLAAGASIFLTNFLQDKDKGVRGDTAMEQSNDRAKDLPPPLAKGTGDAPRTRGGSSPENEEQQQEWRKLREREDALAKQEQQLASRRRTLDLIKEDIKTSREEIDKLRKELNDQAEGTKEDLDKAERKVKNLEDSRAEQENLLKRAQEGIYAADNLRAGNVKRVSGIADTAEPAEVAVILERMIESGNTGLMTAAQIMVSMKERRAAQVLGAMQDKAMAADLLEKMIGLKQAAQSGSAKPLGGKPAGSK